ncbi:glucans biosynthesis glucosyltransferase MdoH [Bordetella genomosp. 1]|uniref:Glucans biosynthesis glucosyltransferase H n=1 Tax=Bordetella genomosp. 1 TaxID=1395607 RepID=A0ABX4EZA9_9BORD|nr:glucans biosynthesis glucosyltransferase MdoH [Bordetella genomosp. 1]OZI65077.1 glucan biosynthesis glucosyltransferase H [Bordetella genomosp. 1]
MTPTPSDPGTLIRGYLDALPDGAARAAMLARGLEAAAAGAEPWRALHETLAGGTAPAEASLASEGARLALLPGAALHDSALLRAEAAGATLAPAPRLHRTPMAPRPWQTNPFVRAWRRLRDDTPQQAPDTRAARTANAADAGQAWRLAGSRRRLALIAAVAAQTTLATLYMKSVLPYQGGQWLEVAILVLFTLLFGWVSAGFWTAMMGFVQLMIGRDRHSISARGLSAAPLDAQARCALVMPICNEDVARVFAGLRATCESLARTDALANFDVFILSDSYRADVCVAEQSAWLSLCEAVDGFGRIFYRRRRRRVKRKSGNIDDFCRRWGADYRYMIVLDADSVMSGECLRALVQLMEAHPDAGIIQTAPQAAGMDTLYARIQQFATRVYGPLFTAGMHYWQLGESHYWGHNAIIRLAPFMQHCVLAPLPGKGAFAGAILSHDFVEAALMRRAGWGVWIAYDLPGSFEELPPNLLDELQRDQRWCHGNLMNFRLFLADGFHPVHRAVFLTGVMSYLSAPLWFLFLALSTALLAVHSLTEPAYFIEPRQLFPLWPQWHPDKAIALFSTTFTLLLLPKVLGVLHAIARSAADYGGAARALASMLLEMLFSMLLAPVRMLFHTRFVLAAFLGLKARWISPARDNDATSWREALRRHGGQTLLGLAWAALVAWLDPVFLFWMAPILLALLLIVPLSVASSRVGPGLRARAAGLFCIPEETRMPAELRATRAYVEASRQRSAGQASFARAVHDPLLNALVCAMGAARRKAGRAGAAARAERVAVAAAALATSAPLDDALRLKLLDDPLAMAQLHRLAWTR